jgi:hypothetical protein
VAEDRDFMTFDEIRGLLKISEGELESLIRSETLKPNIVELEGKVQQVVPKSLINEYRRTIATPKPVVEASDAKPDAVSETIRKVNQAVRPPLELPDPSSTGSSSRPRRMVRLQSGELIDATTSRGKRLFNVELKAEQDAIGQRESAVNEIMKRVRGKQRKLSMPERFGRKVGKYVPNPLLRYGAQFSRNIGGMRGGLMGLGALAGGALIGKMVQGSGDLQRVQELDQEMLRRRARQDMLDLLGRKEQKQAVQMSINQNLAKLQMEAPDLYMRAATGRVLPQGAVVIGGAPRADLLNQLGMAMANGQFRQ